MIPTAPSLCGTSALTAFQEQKPLLLRLVIIFPEERCITNENLQSNRFFKPFEKFSALLTDSIAVLNYF